MDQVIKTGSGDIIKSRFSDYIIRFQDAVIFHSLLYLVDNETQYDQGTDGLRCSSSHFS